MICLVAFVGAPCLVGVPNRATDSVGRPSVPYLTGDEVQQPPVVEHKEVTTCATVQVWHVARHGVPSIAPGTRFQSCWEGILRPKRNPSSSYLRLKT